MKAELKAKNSLLQSQILSQQMQQSLFVLRLNAMELSEFILQEYHQNPLLEMQAPQNESAAHLTEYAGRGATYSMDFPPARGEPGAAQSLRESLHRQAGLILPGQWEKEDIRRAKAVIECLDESGYLHIPLAEICAMYGFSLAQAERALRLVQELEPPGVGARNLSELLWIKAGAQGLQDPALKQILDEHLYHVATRRYDKIGRALRIPEEEAARYGERIRTLSPYIGASAGGVQYIAPDVILTMQGDIPAVSVAEGYIPALHISEAYAGFMPDMNAEERAYVHAHLRNARHTIEAIRQRHRTLQAVATTMIEIQRDFFLHNGGLRPLGIAQIAERNDIHPSTVSRAIQGKHLQYAGGVMPLRALLSRALPHDEARRAASASNAMDLIREIFLDDPTQSDQRIADRLAQQYGISMARRTVAKYRAQLGFTKNKRKKP